MKKFWNLYIDDFLLDKVVNQWIWVKMTRKYIWIFRILLAKTHVSPSDELTYTTKNFKRFLGDCLIERNWSSATYNCYRKCLRCYCEFLKKEWYLTENPIDSIKERLTPKQLPKTLSKAQLKELLDNLPNAYDDTLFYGKRNITIVYTFLHTGLRLSELTELKIAHLQIHDGYIKVVKWKWGKDRTILTCPLVVPRL
jgi:site-specific recombinase XerD